MGAIRRGYYVSNGEVFSPYRKEALVTRVTTKGYKTFNFQSNPVHIHRMVAYQKFGKVILDDKVQVRHKDGNRLNNLEDNILIGSQSDNMLDIPVHIRESSAIKASTKIRKFSDKEMEDIRTFHNGSYKETMEMFNISSKATLHRILNTNYVTKV